MCFIILLKGSLPNIHFFHFLLTCHNKTQSTQEFLNKVDHEPDRKKPSVHVSSQEGRNETSESESDSASSDMSLAIKNDGNCSPDRYETISNQQSSIQGNEYEFDQQSEEYIDKANKVVIHSVVLSDLFPRIKFLDKKNDLKFSMKEGTICQYLFCQFKLNYDENQRELLWKKARKWIQASISRLRSDKSAAVKNAFYGK